MSAFKIQGGRPLHGTVDVPGSKNAALAILSAVPLIEGTVALDNVPDITDVHHKLRLLESLGAQVAWREGTLFIDCTELHSCEADEESVRPIRTSFYLLGSLLARRGYAKLPAPGGCRIGARPVDFHLKGLELLGAKVDLVSGCFVAKAERLVGAEIYLDFPSAGATQHLMATAVRADGVSVIQNAAVEPEVTTLAEFLNRMGARIEGAGTSTVTITGVARLTPGAFRVPEDRLQAGTYLIAGAITGGEVTVTDILPECQTALVNKLREAGAEAAEGPDWVTVSAPKRLKGIRVKTMPYPGFPTDIQQPMAALLGLASGQSVVEETIYESRIGHIPELNRMGAKMTVEGRATVIEGVTCYRGAIVETSDLRAGAALCVAALAAEGETLVKGLALIDRGYDGFEGRLRSLGASVRRLSLTERIGDKAQEE